MTALWRWMVFFLVGCLCFAGGVGAEDPQEAGLFFMICFFLLFCFLLFLFILLFFILFFIFFFLGVQSFSKLLVDHSFLKLFFFSHQSFGSII